MSITTIARAQASIEGQWSPLYNWVGSLGYAYVGTSCRPVTLAHAALIPAGLHRGKVLLWGASVEAGESDPTPPEAGDGCDVTRETWLFDPANPGQLVLIGQDLQSYIMCAGHGWDPSGNLVVVGGEGFGSAPAYPRETYRFSPRTLGAVIPGTGGAPDHIDTSPWHFLGDMAIERSYPIVATLFRVAFAATPSCAGVPSPSYAGGGAFVLGGRVEYNTGSELWDFLKRGESTWSCALLPAIPPDYPSPLTNPEFDYADHSSSITHPTTTYDPIKDAVDSTDYPEVDLDSYPRAFQISTGEVFVAGDVDKAMINTPRHTWVVRPHYSTLPVTNWELSRGPSAPTHREWDTAVILNTRVGASEFNDRILSLGGLNPTGMPPGTRDTADEFVAAGDPVSGNWIAKESLGIPRAWHNAVVLPTSKILVVGGEFPHVSTPVPAGVSPEGYVFTPVLYDPGRTPDGVQAPAQHLAQPNPLVPRRNHSFAVLLPDGRVLVAAGDKTSGDPYPDSWHSGQIYEPAYLHQGFRPTITDIPASASLASTTPPSSPTFTVTAHVRAANTVERVVLLRPAATTHGFDNDQRLIELAFESDVNTYYQIPQAPPMKVVELTVDSPSETLGPQGIYMLFVLEKDATSGELVPSVAEFIDLQ